MDDRDMLKERVAAAIYDDVSAGYRTTETTQLYRKAMLGRRSAHGSDDAPWYSCSPASGLMKSIILELILEKRIKCVTEKQRDYCWLVPVTWVSQARAGFIHVPKFDCEPFDLYDCG